MAKRVLIIGAGGFIGGYLVAESLKRGYETWAGVRASTSRKHLADPAIKFLELDFDAPEKLTDAFKSALPEGEKWDYVIHNLGATKCCNFSDFNRINFGYLRDTVNALRDADRVPEAFLYMSSLSALGPGDEENYTPYTEKSIPMPDTRYGLSKIKAESWLQTQTDFPWIVLRPTGVYGPHEQDYLMMIKSIDSHFDFGVGYRKQMLTFIYVEDLARAAFEAVTHIPATLHHAYIISEPRAYTQGEFREMVAKELGNKFVIPVKLPLFATYMASVVAEKIGLIRMKPSTLNRDKYRIMRQRNWSCDTSAATRDFGFTAQVSLAEGLHHTVKSYLAEKQSKKKPS